VSKIISQNRSPKMETKILPSVWRPFFFKECAWEEERERKGEEDGREGGRKEELPSSPPREREPRRRDEEGGEGRRREEREEKGGEGRRREEKGGEGSMSDFNLGRRGDTVGGGGREEGRGEGGRREGKGEGSTFHIVFQFIKLQGQTLHRTKFSVVPYEGGFYAPCLV
jgi:hypothetical protein